jgi:hypothetical protein
MKVIQFPAQKREKQVILEKFLELDSGDFHSEMLTEKAKKEKFQKIFEFVWETFKSDIDRASAGHMIEKIFENRIQDKVRRCK